MRRGRMERVGLSIGVITTVVVTAAAWGRSSNVPGEIIVGAASRAAVPAVSDSIAAEGCVVLEIEESLGLIRVRTPDGGEDVAMTLLRRRPNVAFVERNGLGRGGAVPNDTYFGAQWHLENTGQDGGQPGADIECVPAWDVAIGAEHVTVAVLDSGVEFDHPEFDGRIDASGYDFVNEDSSPEDDHGHGSLVSGILAANADNGFGVAGVDRGCRVLPVKVLDEDNHGTTFDLVQGILFAANRDDVDVVSMSLINYPESSGLTSALSYARSKGKILVACAGNGGQGDADDSMPGASPWTMSIGATTRFDERASFSGTGLALDFVAPGQTIRTVRFGSAEDESSAFSGCSAATPVVAGIIGLLLDRASELDVALDHDAVYELLRGGAEDEVGPPLEDLPGWDESYGHGRVNARRSLDALRAMACPSDLDGDGVVEGADLDVLLAEWGACDPSCAGDLDADGIVGFADLIGLLAAWGPCR